uniref:Uncharacterized protein n=1 Tax=Candidatus Kentrum sp. LPFa TaxID=2126335 RepID=A0A450VTG6_9GAMM|nr:MAG: hypothetical protein BECKLPF1236A_GA0070988_100137 [Candidatus Kentron sp. LPFa]VFK23228.1 MAG: hypothetical protein BECKLPF1236C_GA0070990_1000416 [Candidatus Kentron sp. LPFa]
MFRWMRGSWPRWSPWCWERQRRSQAIIHALDLLFNPGTKITKRLSELFAGDIELLKRAYLAMENKNTLLSNDYNGAVFDRILDLDPAFITKYIAWKYENAEHGWVSRHDDDRDYAFLWARPDHREVMDRVVESIYEYGRNPFISSDYLSVFFGNKQGRKAPSEETQGRQDTYLLRLIDQRTGDVRFMEYLFDVISRFPPERRILFVERFVRHNKNFDAFERLPLGPSSRSWIGSTVPLLQKDLDYWESLLPIMNTVDLLRHKQYVERYIQGLRAEMAREKKKDFIEDA